MEQLLIEHMLRQKQLQQQYPTSSQPHLDLPQHTLPMPAASLVLGQFTTPSSSATHSSLFSSTSTTSVSSMSPPLPQSQLFSAQRQLLRLQQQQLEANNQHPTPFNSSFTFTTTSSGSLPSTYQAPTNSGLPLPSFSVSTTTTVPIPSGSFFDTPLGAGAYCQPSSLPNAAARISDQNNGTQLRNFNANQPFHY
jgi:hypothetical protein